MASLWEVDPVQISALANGQYPSVGGGTNTWQFLFPAFSTASDGDIHVNMGIAATGNTGSTSGNSGESPIVPEVINATAAQLTTIDSLNGSQAIVRGIFRWYSEHTGERKYEIHPALELRKWNGSAFVVTNDYRSNIRFDNGNTTQSTQHMTTEFDGSDIMTAAVMVADSSKIVFTYPSPRFNYCIYDGVALSGLTNDFVSPYFLLKPNLVPTAVIRCRLVTNTVAAAVAAGLVSNQTVTVNALTRCDMLVVSNKIASLTAGQTGTFTWPVEFITLNVTNLGVISSPPVVSSVTPSCGSTSGGAAITITGNNFVNGATVTVDGNAATGVGFVSSTTLTANTPAGTAGGKNVVVTNPSTQLGTLTNGFSYVAPVSFAGLSTATPAIEAATLAWSAATGTGVTYNVYEGTVSSGENFGSAVTNTSALTALITGLYPGSNSPITYFFVVRASDACGSSESNIVEQSVQPLLDPNKDQDGDGMPNWFEQTYGLNPFDASDATNDADGDGFSNLQEYLAGTDPTNPASAFRITSVVGTGNDVLITWMTGLGRTNALQQTAGTGDGGYDTNGFAAIFIVTNSVSPTTNYLDLGAATNFPSRYYRVRLIR